MGLGKDHWHCAKCLKPARGNVPSVKRTKERCRGRPDAISDKQHKLGHTLWQNSCEGTPLLACRKCGAWMEHTARLLKCKCKGNMGEAGKRTAKHLRNEQCHPKDRRPLDGLMRPYKYNETIHGPSASSVAVKRITRRKLQRLQACTEQTASPMSTTGNCAHASDSQHYGITNEESEWMAAE